MAKNTLILYLRMLFQMAVYLYTSRVLIKVLGVENYGLYDVVGGMVLVLMFLNNSMTTCTQRYITVALGKGDASYLNKVYSAASAIHLLLGIGLIVVGGIAGTFYIQHFLVFPPEKAADVFFVFGCSLLSGMLLIVSMPSNANIIAHEDMGAFAAITTLDVTLKLVTCLSLYLIPEPWLLAAYAAFMLCVAAIVRSTYWLYCRKHYPDICFSLVRDRELYREMASFMGWSTLGNLSVVCNTQGLNLVLNALGGPVVNAARGVAFQMQTAVTSFISSFQTAINPQITKSYAQGQRDTTNRLILASSRLSFLLMMLMAVPLLLETPFLLHLWLVEVPPHAPTFVRLLLCVTLVDCVANPLMVGASATGRVRTYYLTIGTTLLTTLPLAYWAVSHTGQPAAAFAMLLLTTLLAQCLRMVICRNLFGFSIRAFMLQIVRYMLPAALLGMGFPCALMQYLPLQDTAAHLAFCAFCALWAALAAISLGLSHNERHAALQKLKSRLGKGQ